MSEYRAPYSSGYFLSRKLATAGREIMLTPGTQLVNHRYTIKKQLGKGAFGAVYQAYDARRQNDVALKFMRTFEEWAQKALEYEFYVQSRVSNSEHVVQTYDMHALRLHGGTVLLIAMEFAAGGSLWDWVCRHRHDQEYRIEKGIAYFKQLCRGVSAFHKSDIVHLDVKPANAVISRNGVVKLTDSGCARFLYATMVETPSCSCFGGTPEFMAPEIWTSTHPCAIGRKSDVYSLGCTAYMLFHPNCTPPFTGTREQLRHAHLNLAPPPLVGVPSWLALIVARCLEKL